MTEFREIREILNIGDDSFGISEKEVSECENRLGTKLPQVLRDYYLQFGNDEQINQAQDYLVLPPEIEVCEDGFVIFYVENQVVWRAGIKFSNFAEDNPYIYLTYDLKTWEFKNWNLYDFLTTEALHQALSGFPFNAIGELDYVNEECVRRNWKKLEVKSNLWITEFFQNEPDEVLAIMKGKEQTELFVTTKLEKNFIELDKKLGIDWIYNSLEDE